MSSCVAVCTLKDSIKIKGPTIVGPCLTENLGIENIIRAVIHNPKIRFLLLCGTEPEKRFTGQAIKALVDNGIDAKNRILGAKGLMPFLTNLTVSEIEYFRKQVKIVDMTGETGVVKIKQKVAELEKNNPGEFSGHSYESKALEVIEADYDPDSGWTADEKHDENWFVIKLGREKKIILVEHYTGYGENTRRCCIITGTTPESILGTIVKKGKITKLYHAAYMGKELQKAVIALKKNIPYDQEMEFKI